jgi:hypothetical protein
MPTAYYRYSRLDGRDARKMVLDSTLRGIYKITCFALANITANVPLDTVTAPMANMAGRF